MNAQTQMTGELRAIAPSFRLSAILAPLVAIVLGTFMAILDNTVVNVALPTLERVFQANLSTMQWVVTGYMLAQAAVIPLAGWLSDRYGAKRLYLTSLILFSAGSALCALAPSGPMLIGFRVLQGLGGGMLMPIGMAFLYRLAPPERRGTVMGAFGIPILLAPALGPVLSGWLVQYADWRYIFLINVPIGALAVLLGLRALPALPAQRAAGALDTLGAVLGPLGFAALTYGISESTSAGWGGVPTVAGLVVGAAALLAFAARELGTARPLLELRVFRGRDFSLAIVTQWAGFAGLFGAIFLIPLFLQQVRGYGAFDTGLFTVPQAIAAALFMPIGGLLFDRVGARLPVLLGSVLVTVSTWYLAQLTGTTTGADLRWMLAVRGAGMGLMLMPLNTHLLNTAPRHLVSRVTALTGALQNVVMSLTIATLATILQSRATVHLATAQRAIAAYRHTALAQHAGSEHSVLTAVQHYAAMALHGAMAASYDDALLVATAIAAAGTVLAFALRRQPTVTADDIADAAEVESAMGAA